MTYPQNSTDEVQEAGASIVGKSREFIEGVKQLEIEAARVAKRELQQSYCLRDFGLD